MQIMLRVSKEELEKAVYCERQPYCEGCKYFPSKCVSYSNSHALILDLHDAREMIKKLIEPLKDIVSACTDENGKIKNTMVYISSAKEISELLVKSKEYAE